jgi:hypothetical protein
MRNLGVKRVAEFAGSSTTDALIDDIRSACDRPANAVRPNGSNPLMMRHFRVFIARRISRRSGGN